MRFWIITLILSSLVGGLIGGSAVYAIISQIPTPTPRLPPEIPSIITMTVDITTAITDAVSQVGPAVVTVINVLSPQVSFLDGSVEREISGSGVIISSDGYIVTNLHVVEGAERIRVILADGTTLPSSLVGVDQYADLAVLAAPGDMPAVASWGNSDLLQPGETVIAIGSPLGDF